MNDVEPDEADESDAVGEAALALALATRRRRRSGGPAPQDALIAAETAKLAVETRQLRLRHVNERLSVALKLMAVGAGVLALAGLAAMALLASRDHAVVIEPFTAPPDFAQRGVTGEGVAADVMDHFASMNRQVSGYSLKGATDVAADEAREVKLEIPQTGVSVGELWSAMRGWLGHERAVTGALRETADGQLTLIARLTGRDAVAVTGPPGGLDDLERELAEKLFAAADPENWVVYLSQQGRMAEAQDAAAAMAAQARSPLERAQAYALWAGMVDDPVRSRALAAIATSLWPPMQAAAYVVQADERVMGHDEAALAAARRALAARDQDQPAFLRGPGAAVVRAGAQVTIDELTGDFAGAQAAEPRADPTKPGRVALLEARFAARRHDPFHARLLLVESMSPGGPSAVSVALSRYEVDAALGDWASAGADIEATRAGRGQADAATTAPDRAAASRWLEQVYDRPRIAEARLRQGDTAGASATIAATPTDCEPCLVERGRIAFAAGDRAGAARWLAGAVRLGPSLPFAHLELADQRLAAGDAKGAVAELALAQARAPRLADVQDLWGRALMAQGDFATAAARFADAERDAPAWGAAHLHRAEALARLGRASAADDEARAAAARWLGGADRARLSRLFPAVG